jgi:hypothetical protein
MYKPFLLPEWFTSLSAEELSTIGTGVGLILAAAVVAFTARRKKPNEEAASTEPAPPVTAEPVVVTLIREIVKRNEEHQSEVRDELERIKDGLGRVETTLAKIDGRTEGLLGSLNVGRRHS